MGGELDCEIIVHPFAVRDLHSYKKKGEGVIFETAFNLEMIQFRMQFL